MRRLLTGLAAAVLLAGGAGLGGCHHDRPHSDGYPHDGHHYSDNTPVANRHGLA
jgi:hypothetical protein